MRFRGITERYRVLQLYSLLFEYPKLLAIVLLLSGASTVLSVLPPLVTRSIVDQGIVGGDLAALARFSALLVALTLTSALMGALRGYYHAMLSGKVALELRSRVFRKALELGVEIHEKAAVGDVVTRVYGYVERVRRFILSSFESIVLNTLRLAAMLAAVFTLNLKLSLVLLMPLPAYVWGLLKYQPRVRVLYARSWSRVSRMSAYLASILNSVLLVKLFGKEREEERRFRSLAGEVFETRMEVTRYSLKVLPWLNLLLATTSAAVLYLGGLMVINGETSLGTLTAFLAYVWQVYGPVQAITSLIPQLAEAETAYEKLGELLEAAPRVKEKPDAIEVELKGSVETRDVWFGYSPEKPVLKGVSFSAKPGEVIGVVGPNGAGKSTLARIIARLYDPNKGSVLFDGIDARAIKLRSLRKNVMLVPQEPLLLPGSVAYNIAYGADRPDPLSVMYAAWLCGAHRFVIELPLAYDSDVGEQGRVLSGGQRQLICLARAALLKPKVLVLDEATSNVYVELEEVIMTRLLGYLRKTTIIAISHRPTLIKFVERVLVMDEGRVKNEVKGGLKRRPSPPSPLRVIEASKVKVIDRGAWLEVKTKGSTISEARARLPFPLTWPELLVLYRDPDDMIVVPDWTRLDPVSRAAVARHLIREHGFEPAVLLKATPVGGRRAFSINLVVKSKDGIEQVTVPSGSVLALDNNLIIAAPTRVYLVDLTKSDKRAVESIAALASTPLNPFGKLEAKLLELLGKVTNDEAKPDTRPALARREGAKRRVR